MSFKRLFKMYPKYLKWKGLNCLSSFFHFDQVAMSAQKTANITAGVKRKAISFDGENASGGNSNTKGNGNYFKKRQSGPNQVYEPPQGKYSSNLGKVGKF